MKSNDLFDLIKSLSSNEKRFFRKHAKRHLDEGNNYYLDIFNVLLKQEKYDETKIKEKLKSKGSKYAAHLAVAKNYLYNQILEALDLLYKKHSLKEELKQQLHIAQILYQKGLLSQADKLLKRVKKKIDEYELLELLPEFIFIKSKILAEQRCKVKDFNKFYNQSLSELGLFDNLLFHWASYHKMQLWIYHDLFGAKSPILEIYKNLENTETQTNIAAIYKSASQSANALVFRDAKQTIEAHEKVIDLFIKNEHQQSLFPEMFLASVGSLLVSYNREGNFDAALKQLKELERMKTNSKLTNIPNLMAKIYLAYFMFKPKFYIAQSQFVEILELLPELHKEWKKYEPEILDYYKIIHYHNMAHIYFATDYYSKALDWLTQLFQLYSKNLGSATTECYWLYLVTHYELENWLYLDNIIATIKRKRLEAKELTELDKSILNFFTDLIAQESKRQQKEIFKEFRKLLGQHFSLSKGREVLKYFYFNIYAWVNSKVEQTSFVEESAKFSF